MATERHWNEDSRCKVTYKYNFTDMGAEWYRTEKDCDVRGYGMGAMQNVK